MSTLSFSLLIFHCISAGFSREALPFVQTDLGGIVGSYKESYGGRQYEAYEGVPYALPPVGERRFQPPVPIAQWVGNLTANKLPSRCIQYLNAQVEDRVVGDEDCLFLNVYVPTRVDASKPLPVLFAIHGGAFQFGESLSGSRFLMDKDVIVVGINYRLGPFGFLSTEDELVPGNMGLKDQSLALRWTWRHIGSFGGDRQRITLIGHSGGGASVHFHYLSAMSKGLFRNGISLSGTALGPRKTCDHSREKVEKLAAVLGCPTANLTEAVECLRYRPPRPISEATKHFMPWLYYPFTPFGPVIERAGDEPFIHRSPIEIISSGDAADVPWITSVVSDEGLYQAAEIVNNEAYLEDLDENWDTIAPFLLDFNFTIPVEKHAEVARQIRSHYFETRPISKKSAKELVAVIGDRLYVVDAEKAARAQARANKSPVLFWYYSYRALTRHSDELGKVMDSYGAGHADDINMIFENKIIRPEMNTKDRAMQEKLIDFVVSVGEKGYPDLDLYFEWKRVDPSKDELDFLLIAGPEIMRMESKANLGQKNFWSTIDFNENKLNSDKQCSIDSAA